MITSIVEDIYYCRIVRTSIMKIVYLKKIKNGCINNNIILEQQMDYYEIKYTCAKS